MNYSKAHQRFSNYLQRPEALTNPQDFLGPNYEVVINFWWYLESLSEISEIDYCSHSVTKIYGYNNFIINNAKFLTIHQASAWYATQSALNIGEWYGWVTVELICMNQILDDGKYLFYLPKIFEK
jgi:hypothetical protein